MDREHLDELRELVEFLKANEIAEFDMERSDVKLRIKFAGARVQEEVRSAASAAPAVLGSSAPAPASPGLAAASGLSESAPATAEESLHEVKSPIVGTFYESPAPGAAPFVKVGDQVEAGQVLCIVEAMKLMNEIEADVAGEIVRRIASPGQPVEYGQALFSVRTR